MSLESMFGMPDEEFLQNELAKYRRDPSSGSGGMNGGVPIFDFKNGITTFRVLPPTPGAVAWHREIYRHWVKTAAHNGPLTCPDVPRSGIKTCPLCAKSWSLVESKEEPSVKLGNSIRRQMKVLMNILVTSAPPGVEFDQGKVYVALAPRQVVKELIGYDRDDQSDFPDITGIRSAMSGGTLNGLMFKVIRSGAGFQTAYTVQPTASRVDLVTQLESYGKKLDDIQLYDLSTLFPVKPLEDLKVIADQIEVEDQFDIPSAAANLKIAESPAWAADIKPPKL